MTPVVRHPQFDLASIDNPVFTPAAPEFALAANAVSLMMPYLEPLVARSTREALPLLPTDLSSDAAAYAAQETAHLRKHREYNAMLRSHYRLRWVESSLGRVYTLLGRRTSLAFRLAYASASETVAYVIARWTDERAARLFAGSDPVATRLFVWHLAEEVEHKSVAFDVHRFVAPGRMRSALAVAATLAVMAVFVTWSMTIMALAEGLWWRPLSWARLVRWSVSFAFDLLPTLAVSLFADHHPGHLVDPGTYGAWLASYDALSRGDSPDPMGITQRVPL